jgi:hypothetical protein
MHMEKAMGAKFFDHPKGGLEASDLNRPGFHPKLAWWLAECSRLAYEPKQTVMRELTAVRARKIYFFDTGGTQAFLSVHESLAPNPAEAATRFAALVFRGTEKNYADILTDVNWLPTKAQDERAGEQSEAHSGFVAALELVWGNVLSGDPPDAKWIGTPGIGNILNEPDLAGMPIFFTGHSLGGALATLAAHRHSSAVLYTFGSPRVAGSELADKLNAGPQAGGITAFRVVHSLDIVPRLPLPFGFKHVGRPWFLTRIPRLSRAIRSGRWEWFAIVLEVISLVLVPLALASQLMQLIGWIRSRLAPPSKTHGRMRWALSLPLGLLVAPFADHAIDRYRRKLAALF